MSTSLILERPGYIVTIQEQHPGGKVFITYRDTERFHLYDFENALEALGVVQEVKEVGNE
jgi:hypothetical protein